MRHRRLLFVALFLLFAVNAAYGDVPSSMVVQGRLTDNTGTPLPAGSKTFTFKIYTDTTGGIEVWPGGAGETQTVVTDPDGLWTTRIGALVPLAEGVFAESTRWLEITVDDGVNPITTLPRVRLVSGPYAHRVSTVDGASGGNITSNVSIGPGHDVSGSWAHAVGYYNTAMGHSSVAMGRSNEATAEGAVVAGGGNNYARGWYSSVGGGGGALASDSNLAEGNHAIVGGGRDNYATENFAYIGSGINNRSSAFLSVVSGGQDNECSNAAGFIGAGRYNKVSGPQAVVVAGQNNEAQGTNSFIGGGEYNIARGNYSAVLGGGGPDFFDSNAALGSYSTVAGGRRNKASGDYSFAAGLGAQAEHSGSFVWSDGLGGASSSAPNQFIIKATGGVGIITDNPLAPLHIQEQIAWVETAHLQEDDIIVEDDDAIIGLYSNTDGVAGSGIALGEVTLLDGLIDKWAFLRETGGGGSGLRISYGPSDNPYTNTTVMYLDDNAKVGIGIESPTYRLTLPNIASSNGRGLANAWHTYSSRRWKDDIKPIDNALATVNQLRGVTFKWKDNDGRDIGLIAEEVGEVIPEVVSYDDNGVDAQSVDYARLVAVLIEGIKELKTENDQRQAEIEQLRRQVEGLSASR